MNKIVLALLLVFSGAAFAGPKEAVSSTIQKLLDILNGTNEQQKVSELCGLVRSDVEYQTIGDILLGTFAHADDANGIKKFKAAVPSIIMDQFYGLLSGKGGAKFTIDGEAPKGSSKVGVKVTVAGTKLVVTVLKASNKVIDVEWNSFSLVNTKRDEIQRALDDNLKTGNQPVSDLVKKLEQDGINKCN